MFKCDDKHGVFVVLSVGSRDCNSSKVAIGKDTSSTRGGCSQWWRTWPPEQRPMLPTSMELGIGISLQHCQHRFFNLFVTTFDIKKHILGPSLDRASVRLHASSCSPGRVFFACRSENPIVPSNDPILGIPCSSVCFILCYDYATVSFNYDTVTCTTVHLGDNLNKSHVWVPEMA